MGGIPGGTGKDPPWKKLWMFLVGLVHHMWHTTEIPQKLVWTILVLILNRTTNTRGISLLENPVEVGGGADRHSPQHQLVDACRPPRFQGQKRDGDGNNGAKGRPGACQHRTGPLLVVFLDLGKAFDNVDRDRLIITLEGYGAGHQMCGILDTFWDFQKLVTGKPGPWKPFFLVTNF